MISILMLYFVTFIVCIICLVHVKVLVFYNYKKILFTKTMATKQVTNNQTKIDLTIFKTHQQHQCFDSQNYNQCLSILRLCVALRYYTLLNPLNNQQQQDTLTHFTTNIYYI